MRVQVVEDNAALRAVACLEVQMAHDLQLVAASPDGVQAIAAARVHRPDVILLDVEMPVMNGLDALPQLVEIVPDALIVVYTSARSSAVRAEAFRRGAAAFAAKGDTPISGVLTMVREHSAHRLRPA